MYLKYPAIIFISILITACPVSKHPLGPLSQAKYPKDLMATWILKENQQTGFLHMGKEDDGSIKVLTIGHNGEKLEQERYAGHGNRIGDEYYLSLRKVFPKAEEEYSLVHYRLRGNRLEFAIASEHFIKKAVKDKSIKGTINIIKEGKLQIESALITADPSSLANFIRRHHKKLFLEYKTLQRVP